VLVWASPWGVRPLAAADENVVHRWEFRRPADAAGWSETHHLKDVRVVDGVLRMSIAGADPFIVAPPVQVPLDGCVLRVTLRADADGNTQVYWTTGDYPTFGEQQVQNRHTPRSPPLSAPLSQRPFTTLEYPLGHPSDSGRTLTRFRIDPYNGSLDGTVEIQSVELLRPPAVLDIRFAPATHQAAPGERVLLPFSIRHVAGRAAEAQYRVRWAGGQPVAVRPGEKTNPATGEIRQDRPGVHQATAAVESTGGKLLYELVTSIIIGQGDTLPLKPALRSKDVRLDLIPTPDGKAIGAARWMAAVGADEWKLAGWLLPLAEIAVRLPDGRVVRRQPTFVEVESTVSRVKLAGYAQEGDHRWAIDVELTLEDRYGPDTVAVQAMLRGPDGGELLDFAAPVLRCRRDRQSDSLERFAVFGGLEFLEPGWPSSSERAVGELFADRWTPHPFKVTTPVMAVEAEGLTTALMWHPLQTWNGTDAMPTATFASPNFLDGQPNHLMRLSVPSIPQWRQENEATARTSYAMKFDRPLTLTYVLYAEPNLPAGLACRRWYETFGAPPPPPLPHSDRRTYDLIARNFGEVMWWPEEQGWRHHWYHHEKSSRFVPYIAAELLAHAAQTGETRWIERTGLTGRTIIDTAGTLASRLTAQGRPEAQISSMRPDGTWPFVNTPQLREQTRQFTQGKHDSLGEDGSTSLGTCVQPALPILRYALLSGDEKCVSAGVKALKAMRQFRVPRGAQVWEVHQQIPDIRAAALAVEAYTMGFQLTGDRAFLADANYWAWTGAPFIYSWRVPVDRVTGRMVASDGRDDPNRVSRPMGDGFENPHRQVMPYASVPVLGPTFYVVNWFGVVVQWCGLEWAQKVIELDAFHPDPLLRYIAEGVVASGRQQMFDKPPWTGLYPDVWDTQANIAHGALIYAGLPLACLQAQGRAPRWAVPWTRVIQDDFLRLTWHVSGWGPVPVLEPPGRLDWEVTLQYPEGQPNELLLTPVDEPTRVLVGETALEEFQPAEKPLHVPGWQYLPGRRALSIRFCQPAPSTNVRVLW
jgi:hypothetical protein